MVMEYINKYIKLKNNVRNTIKWLVQEYRDKEKVL